MPYVKNHTWCEVSGAVLARLRRSVTQWCKVTKYICVSTVLKYNFDICILLEYFQSAILLLLLHYILDPNIVLLLHYIYLKSLATSYFAYIETFPTNLFVVGSWESVICCVICCGSQENGCVVLLCFLEK